MKNMITLIKSGKISRDIARMCETTNVYKTSAKNSGNRENDGKILVYLSTCLRVLVRTCKTVMDLGVP
jgi:hypothetical protein